jgi:tRNA nucleotidyltransferase/poly(A) polymerase
VSDLIKEKDVSKGLVPLRVVVDAALRVAEARDERVVIVGGFVRDLLMRRSVGDYDLDLVVEGNGLAFSHALQGEIGGERREHVSFLTSKLFSPFGTESGVAPYLSEVDVATARSEEYASPGALPVVKPTTIESDLWRRDFSSNALALPLSAYRDLLAADISSDDLNAHVIDPCGGLTDIKTATLRILHPQSFIDDPTRLFRAVRYVVRLSFNFDRATLAGFYEAVRGGALATLSPRRVWNEVVTALGEGSPAEVLQEFVERGLFSHLPIIEEERGEDVVDAIHAIVPYRAAVTTAEFLEAGKIMILAFLLQEGREDIAQATSEGTRMLRRAKAAVDGRLSVSAIQTKADGLAMYGLLRQQEFLECLKNGSES